MLEKSADKQPVQFFVLPGLVADETALQMMHLDLPFCSEVFGDAGYTDCELEAFYGECEQIDLQIQHKSNSKRPDQACQAAYKKALCQRIEQVFSRITMGFPKMIYAVTKEGLLIKIVLFLLAYALETSV